MKVLITGGNGFIGSHLGEQLLSRGHTVSILDREFGPNTQNLECEKVVGDIRDPEIVASVVKGKDAVFHLAAVSRVVWGQDDPLTCWHTNVQGTVNVLEACRRSKPEPCIFYASSREVYGEPRDFPVAESHPKNPKSTYGMSKLCAENACLSYWRNYKLRTIILRFSNVYGSWRDQLDRVTPNFALRALRGEDLVVQGGDQTLDFTFIDDVVAGILRTHERATNGDMWGEDFHFVRGQGVSVRELAKVILRVFHSDSRIKISPGRDYDVMRFVGDPFKASRVLGFVCATSLEDGVIKLRNLAERVRSDRDQA